MDNHAPIQANVQGAGELATVAREQAEIQARMIMAKKAPRDERQAIARLSQSLQRPALAEKAEWRFKRGKSEDGKDLYIDGPSAHLAREAARCWGNLSSGFRIVSVDDTYVHIRAFCTDLETNTTKEFEEKFKKLIFRKFGGWITPDERQLRELVNKHGAIIERNAILGIIPRDIIDDARATARKTIRLKAKGDLTERREDVIRRLVVAFNAFGVNSEMLDEYLGHKLDLLTEEELVNLRSIYTSIEDGNSKPSEYFGGTKEPETDPARSDLEKSLLESTVEGARFE